LEITYTVWLLAQKEHQNQARCFKVDSISKRVEFICFNKFTTMVFHISSGSAVFCVFEVWLKEPGVVGLVDAEFGLGAISE
jgi:hypothetical protein